MANGADESQLVALSRPIVSGMSTSRTRGKIVQISLWSGFAVVRYLGEEYGGDIVYHRVGGNWRLLTQVDYYAIAKDLARGRVPEPIAQTLVAGIYQCPARMQHATGGYVSCRVDAPLPRVVMKIDLNTDEEQLIRQTTDAMMGELSASASKPSIKALSIYKGYAIAMYLFGEGGGEKIYQKSADAWKLIGGGGGMADASSLHDYGVPRIIGDRLVFGIANCPPSIQHRTPDGISCRLDDR